MLYSQLIEVPYDDQSRLNQLIPRFERLHRQDPNDTVVSLALLDAYSKYGDAVRANDFAERLWLVRSSMDRHFAANYSGSLFMLGSYERFLEFTGKFQSFNPPLRPTWLSQAVFQAYWRLGDLNGMATVQDVLDTQYIDKLKEKLSEIEFLEAFHLHQATLAKMLLGKQLNCTLMFDVDPDGHIEASTTVFMAGSYKERTQLEDDLRDNLDKLALSKGVSISKLRSILPVYILPFSTIALSKAA